MTMPRQVLVTGETRFIGLVGDPVSHIRSPEFYNPRLVRVGANVLLIPVHVPTDLFETTIPGLQQVGNFAGLIFTAPFKERAARFADEILPSGMQVGAINAMRRGQDGRWTADIFDGIGLVRALEAMDAAPVGKRILLLGAGGAGRAIALSLARAGARALTLFDRNPERLRGSPPTSRASIRPAPWRRQRRPRLTGTTLSSMRRRSVWRLATVCRHRWDRSIPPAWCSTSCRSRT